MPFYRFDGFDNPVHVRGTRMPKACLETIGLADGAVRSVHVCMRMSGFYCDHPTSGGATCDRPLCDAHARQVGQNRHYCPQHFADQSGEARQPSLFTSLVKP